MNSKCIIIITTRKYTTKIVLKDKKPTESSFNVLK